MSLVTCRMVFLYVFMLFLHSQEVTLYNMKSLKMSGRWPCGRYSLEDSFRKKRILVLGRDGTYKVVNMLSFSRAILV